MLSFSQYLKLRHINTTISAEEIAIWLPGWIESLQETILKLHEKNLISLRVFTICTEKFDAWQDDPTHYILHYSTVTHIDEIYQKLIFFIRNDMSFSPRKLNILGGYPFASKVSGVQLKVRLVTRDEQTGFEFSHQQRTTGFAGSKDQPRNLKQNIKTKIGLTSWISDSLAHFGHSITDLPTEHPHAELIWCVEHSDELLSHLLLEPSFADLPSLNDDFPYDQLIQTPRLEIITSSSCCGHCQMLFAGLRWKLESAGIHLPIVLYANTAYNNTAVYREMQGSVYVITSTGNFFNTNVQCNVPHCHYPPQEQLPIEVRVHKKLSSKDEIDYLCLLYLGGLALMDLIAHGVVEKKADTINALTYIAPDTLIIFAAEQLPQLQGVAPELAEAIQYLAKTLDQIDMRLLTAWRATFNDQLHWLLISHLDPRFRESALKSIAATNISFLIENNVHGDTDAQLFYRHFALLWSSVKNLTKKYQRMLNYFTESGHQRMPLGVMVGPLSENMRTQVFTELSAQNLRKMSIYKPLPAVNATENAPKNKTKAKMKP